MSSIEIDVDLSEYHDKVMDYALQYVDCDENNNEEFDKYVTDDTLKLLCEKLENIPQAYHNDIIERMSNDVEEKGIFNYIKNKK